jgi:crotonobetainyl-CoA:carnitine CoA-transferase CaiB-like acyl-CoA transferase
MPRILDGLRILDLSSGMAGPRATGILADYGADVIWVEPVGGCPYRTRLQVPYSVFNRGKRSIELDIGAQSSERAALLAWADVLVHTYQPVHAQQLALDHATLSSMHPALVVCSITGFGQDGPLRDVPAREALVHALIGTMGEQVGHRDDGPIYEGLPFASMGAAYLSTVGITAALYKRSQDGIGREVETSLYDGALVYLAMMWGDTDTNKQNTAHTEDSFMPAGNGRLITGSFRCADDEYIGVHTGAVGAFGRLMKLLGLDDRIPAAENGLDMGIPLTAEQQAVLKDNIHEIFASRPRADWVRDMVEADVCGIPALRPTQVYDEAQTIHNRMVLRVDDPDLGPIDQVAPPARFSVEPEPSSTPAPRVGEHAAEILAQLRQPHSPRPWLGSTPADSRPLLDGVKVLDLGAMYAGPCASRHLADLGADVIKLEPTLGDGMRGLPLIFRNCQAGKRAIAADLKDPALNEAREKLASWADIVHHNMRPGAAERMGVGEEQVRAVNTSVIYGYAPGWGPDGPFARRQSFEPMLSGYVGAQFEVAGQFNGPIYPLGNADPGNGMVGALAMLLSLLHRQRTGQGLSFLNPQLNATMTHTSHIVRTAEGEILGAERLDPLQMGVSALDRLYRTSDGWLCLVAESDEEIAALSGVVGVEILGDARFSTAAARTENDYELGFAVGDVLELKDTASWLKILGEAGVPAAEPKPFNNQAFMRDPENQRTRRVAELPHPTEGKVREPDQYMRISDASLPPHRLAPALGEHTGEILRWLGYGAERISLLAAKGVIKLA